MRISDDLRTILFRNVRELLANVIRHSGASNVIVSLDSNESEVKIIVHDNGVGFDDGEEISSVKSNSGFGLFSIKERMEDFGGTLTIESEPGKGCKAIMTASLD
jgi:signal transduction histidine kinase